MSTRTLIPRAQQILSEYPPFLRNEKHLMALANCIGQEHEDLDAAIAQVRDDAFPTLTNSARLWEGVLDLPSDPGQTALARRTAILAQLAQVISEGTGSAWEAAMNKIFNGGSWYYDEYVPTSDRRTNLVTNPAGRVNTTGWTTVNAPAVFAQAASLPTTTGLPTGITTGFRLSTAGTTDYAQIDLGAVITVGQTYTATVYVRRAAGSGNPTLDVRGNNGAISYGTNGNSAASWTRLQVTFTASHADVELRLQAATAAADFHFTAVMLEKIGAPGSYFDGAISRFEWTGTADASSSTTRTSTNAYDVDVFIPFDPDSNQALVAEQLARAITPANLALNVTYVSGFMLGYSTLGDLL